MGKPGRPTPGLDEYLYWQERMASREASGLSIDEFCVEEDISKSTFYRWAQKLKEGVPEEVQQDAADLSVEDVKFLPVSITSSPIEIELPNGGLVRLPVGIGQTAIVAIIQAVTGLQTKRKPTS
jgi:hypothetical protein